MDMISNARDVVIIVEYWLKKLKTSCPYFVSTLRKRKCEYRRGGKKLPEYKRTSCEGCKYHVQGKNLDFLCCNLHGPCRDFEMWIAKEEGLKFDGEKDRWDLLPLDAVRPSVKIITYGAKKYAPNNWQKVDVERYWAAFFRHIEAHRRGEKNDPESGFPHLWHAQCNLLFIVWKDLHDAE